MLHAHNKQCGELNLDISAPPIAKT